MHKNHHWPFDANGVPLEDEELTITGRANVCRFPNHRTGPPPRVSVFDRPDPPEPRKPYWVSVAVVLGSLLLVGGIVTGVVLWLHR